MLVMRLQSGVRSHFVTRMPEWVLSATLASFGAQLLGPGNSFRSSQGYVLLSRYVSEGTWGAVSLTIAGAWFTALIINGSLRQARQVTPWVRSICGLAAAGFWMTNATVILLAVPASPGVTNNAGFAFLALASSIITAREIGRIGTAQKCRKPRTIG